MKTHQNKIAVSICMITYNHEEFIEEALVSVLEQNCHFDFEVILSNDCSKDKTDEVINKIIKNHPKGHTIRYTNQEKNLGMNENFIFILEQVKGKYIALLEGDDYWTDKNKLQKQFDFLENNPQYVACFHNAWIENTIENTKYEYHNWKDSREVTSKEVIEIGGYVFPTAALMFRSTSKFIQLNKYVAGDLAMALDLLSQGKFYFIKDYMSVYRRHENGVYSGLLKDAKRFQNFEESVIVLIKEKQKLFSNEYYDYFNNAIKVKYSKLFYKNKYPLYNLLKAYKYFTIRELISIIKFNLKK